MYAPPSPPPLSPGWRPGKLIGHVVKQRQVRRRRREQEQVERWQCEEVQQQRQPGQEEEEWADDDVDDGSSCEHVDHADVSTSDGDVTLDEWGSALRHRRKNERVKVQVRASPPPTNAAAAAGSEATSSGGGGWYLGKLTGRLIRRGLLAFVGEEEVQRRRDGAPVVARLRVRFQGVRGLKGVLNPYLEMICEGTRRVLKPGRFKEEGSAGEGALDPEWSEATLSFAVTDITTNVHVLLLDKRPLRTVPVGRLIVPLTNLMGASAPLPPRLCAYDLVNAASIDTDRKLMYQKYAPQMTPTPSEDSGGDDEGGEGEGEVPVAVVGQVVMEVQLETQRNLVQTYIASRPLLQDSFVRASPAPHPTTTGSTTTASPPPEHDSSFSSSSSSFSTRQLAINVFRVRRALQPPPLLLLLLDAPLAFHPLLLLLCRSPLCLLPLQLLAFAFLNGLLACRAPVMGGSSSSVERWPEPLVERVLQMENTSAPAKLRKLRRLAKYVQDQLGVLASGLERSAFLLSWADPRVTLPVQLGLTVAALLASLTLYLVPTRLLLWGLGTAIYTRLRRARQAQLKAAASAPASPRRPPRTPRTSAGAAVVEEQEEEEEDDDDWENSVLDLDWRDWLADQRRRGALFPSLMKHLVARAPDLPEVMHREIAKRRVHAESVAAAAKGGGS